MISGGQKFNIIPSTVEMFGTIRVFDQKTRKSIHEKVKNTAEMIAKSAGGTAEAKIREVYGITCNDPSLTKLMAPTFQRFVGEKAIVPFPQLIGSEDFSFYQEKIPGLYFFLGAITPGKIFLPILLFFSLMKSSASEYVQCLM